MMRKRDFRLLSIGLSVRRPMKWARRRRNRRHELVTKEKLSCLHRVKETKEKS